MRFRTCTSARRSPSPKLEVDPSKWPAFVRVAWTAIQNFGEDGCARHAAALAYYGVFSIGPFLFVAVPIVQFFTGRSKLPLQDVIGYEAGDFSRAGWVGIIVLLFTASGASTALVSSFGRIFQKNEKVETWWRKSLIERLLGIALVLAGGLFLASFAITSLVVSIATGAFQAPVSKALDFIASWLVASLMMTGVYRWVPYHFDLPWKPALIGGVVGGLLGALLKSLYATIIKATGLRDLSSAANSLVILMFFVYLAAMTLFIGAEVAKAVNEQNTKSVDT